MALQGLASLFTGPNKTGGSSLIGISMDQRYGHLDGDGLRLQGLYQKIRSGAIFSASDVDLRLTFFSNDDFTGGFLQLTNPARHGELDFWLNGCNSVMMTATHHQGRTERRLSFRDQFLGFWNDTIDAQFHPIEFFFGVPLHVEKARRVGDPLLTWEMFPHNYDRPSGWGLDPRLTYLRVHQRITAITPQFFADYPASLDYWIMLFIDGNGHLRAWVAQWSAWADGGIIHDQVLDKLFSNVQDGAQTLQTTLNEKLSALDSFGTVRNIYYLPGNQLVDDGTIEVRGNTNDDVTIVIES